MNNLSNTIYTYYIGHFSDLAFDKQFHFTSRLQLWSQEAGLRELLNDLRPQFTQQDNPRQAIDEVIKLAQSLPSHGSKNAAQLRQPYFDRYPNLKTYVTVLFRLTFMQTIYDIDARQLFHELFPEAEVTELASRLTQDDQALAILSTHAINFLYLYERFIKQDDVSLDPGLFLDIGQSQYDLSNKLHLQLLIYLYTHCIIGESQFYYRVLPSRHLGSYQLMLEQLEGLIEDNFNDINLDNKFEFLVAAKLVNFTSNLGDRIWAEAGSSLAADGSFIVDTHNGNPQTDNATFDKSEHRNVLCIMADRPFRPLG